MRVKLGDIAVLINGDRGKNYPSQADILPNGPIPFVNAGHLDGKDINFDAMKYISQEKYDQLKTGKFIKGDILYCLRGSLGKKAAIRDSLSGAIASSLVIIRPNSEKVDLEYLMYALDSSDIKEQLARANNGSSQPNLSAASVKAYNIDLPDKESQKKIAMHLTKVDMIINEYKQELQKLDELIKSRFVEMFGDPIKNSKGWKVVTIGDVVTEIRYGTSKPAVEGGKYPYLRMNNLTVDGHLDLNDLKYINIPDDEIEKCVVRKGDVLFNRTNSIELVGKTAVFDLSEEMIIAGYIIRVRLNEKILPEVLSQYMNLEALKDVLRGMAKGAVNQANINAQELQNIKIYLPDMKLQKQFIQLKKQIDKSKVEVQKALDQAQLLFDSLMQKYFG